MRCFGGHLQGNVPTPDRQQATNKRLKTFHSPLSWRGVGGGCTQQDIRLNSLTS